MERITVNKDSQLKSLIFDALKHQEFDLVVKTNTTYPISVYYQVKSRAVAIYNCKPDHDEFITIEGDKPGKLEIIINEFKHSGAEDGNDIAEKLTEIMDFRKPKKLDVIYLTQL